jgi:hypothetical protein
VTAESEETTMATTAQLTDAFRVPLAEMDRCVTGQCYWALLHLVVVIPDICSALEAANSKATKAGYINWCQRMFPPGPPAPLNPIERYELRCIVLHQGRTLASRGRYAYYKFVPSSPPGIRAHGTQMASDQITLGVVEMAEETKRALKDWFQDLQDPAEAQRRARVAQNLPTLVTVKVQPLPGIGGFPVNVTHTSTST